MTNSLNPAWFIGVVEDINDPSEMGRVRVRAFGYHTENKSKIPTESLPWASMSMPVTSASISGVGQSSTGILQGSWVVGMFIDGETAQKPLIIATLPSRSGVKSNDPLVGFFDPDGVYPRTENEIDMPLDATTRFAESEEFQKRQSKRALGQNVDRGFGGGTWSAPLPSANQNTQAPYSKVRKTESGFVEEIDDTPGSERFLQQHKSGTHIEVLPDGTRVAYVEGADYLIVKDKCRIFVDDDLDISASGDIHFKSDKEFKVDAKAIRLNQ